MTREDYAKLSGAQKGRIQVEITKLGNPSDKKTVTLRYIESPEGKKALKIHGYVVTDERFKDINVLPSTSPVNPTADKMAEMEARIAELTALVTQTNNVKEPEPPQKEELVDEEETQIPQDNQEKKSAGRPKRQDK